ncbi:MAG: hypothetical protein ACRC4M_01090 [Mycoplasma sp.]
MEIKKEFVNLILKNERHYEFRKENDLEGIYKIGDEYFELRKQNSSKQHSLFFIIDAKLKFKSQNIYYYNGDNTKYEITKQEYDFLKTYIEIDKPIYIYRWIKFRSTKELKIVD